MKKFLSRKLIFAIVILAVGSFALLNKTMDATQWTNLVQWVFGIYVTGNVAGSIKK